MAKTTKKPAAKKAAKKPSAAQLAARKKFAAMAKARAKAAKAKKPAAKKSAAKKTTNTYQTGSSNKLYDSRKKAQSPGKRVSKGGANQYGVSKGGSVYYERRKNRSDMPGSLTGLENFNPKYKLDNFKNYKKYKKHIIDVVQLSNGKKEYWLISPATSQPLFSVSTLAQAKKIIDRNIDFLKNNKI